MIPVTRVIAVDIVPVCVMKNAKIAATILASVQFVPAAVKKIARITATIVGRVPVIHAIVVANVPKRTPLAILANNVSKHVMRVYVLLAICVR